MTQTSKQIPEGWTVKALADICDILIGGTPSRSKPEYWDKNKKDQNIWISIRDLSNGGKYISDSSEYISDKGAKSSNVKLIPKGNVLMSFKLTIGRTAITNREVYTNEAIAAFLVKDDSLLDSNFLYYALPGLQYDTDTAIKGATLNKEKLKTTDIILPSLSEQTKIATILSKVDGEIEKVKQIIKHTEKIKKGLMQQLLTKGLGHTKFKKTELGEIPEEWEVVRLEEICKFIDYRGKTPQKTSSGVPLITAKNVRMGYIDVEPREYIAESNYNSWMTRGFPKYGDVLFTTEAPLGYVAQLKISGKIALAQRIITLQPRSNNLLSDFLAYILMNTRIQNAIHSMGTGGTVKGIKAKLLKTLIIPIPNSKEQKQIAQILSKIDNKIKINQKIKFHLQKLKKGLMNDLLSGRVRVNN